MNLLYQNNKLFYKRTKMSAAFPTLSIPLQLYLSF